MNIEAADCPDRRQAPGASPSWGWRLLHRCQRSGVVPTTVEGNITLAGGGGNDKADCDAEDGIETGNTGGSDTTDNGVTVTWTYDGTTKEFGFTATGGLVTIAYVKGGNAYNVYDYGAGVAVGRRHVRPRHERRWRPQA